MISINSFEKCKYFKKVSLNEGQILFDEGAYDNNIYIIKSGKISIEKYTTIQKQDTKQLALLDSWSFFGEGWISIPHIKEVRAIAIENTELLALDTKKDFQEFIEENPHEGFLFIREIINVSNQRLLAANKEITASYEIDKYINKIENIDWKNIFLLIDRIKSIVGCNYILYLESNEAIKNILILKYDTRFKWKLKNLQIAVDGNLDYKDLRRNKIYASKFNVIVKLSIASIDLWYLVFGNNLIEFSYDEYKMILGIANRITGVLRQRKILEEERNKNYIKSNI